MIKPWLFEFFPELGDEARIPEPSDTADYFARYLDFWTRDEALGFEGIFFSEHHFGGSFSASPNLLIAALAMRTQKLRLGVMGVVLPYYHPARVVEEIGLLDHLTGGRLEVGTAVGVPQELARLGMTMEEARERSADRRRHRCGSRPASRLASRKAFLVRQPAAPAEDAAAALAAALDRRGERGVGTAGGATRRQDLDRLQFHGDDQDDLRRLPRGSRRRRPPRRPGMPRLAPPGRRGGDRRRGAGLCRRRVRAPEELCGAG
jgi:hypothetical protein